MAIEKRPEKEEKHTINEWIKKLGSEPQARQLTKEQYEAMIKRQAIAKNLVSAGKNILGGIARRVATTGPELLGKLGQRLAENYDEAVGNPAFGTGIRELLGYPQLAVQGMPGMQGMPPEQAALMQRRQAVRQGLSPDQVGYIDYLEAQGMPPEAAKAELIALQQAEQIEQQKMAQMTPEQQAAYVQQKAQGGYGYGPAQWQVPPEEKQVVFFFDTKDNTISEVLGEFDTVPEAETEVGKLRKQGLPAFFAAKGYYLNKARLKA